MLSRIVSRIRRKWIDLFLGKPDLASTFAVIVDGVSKESGRIFVQIGAGAGDQDSRAGYRDGFTEFVKSLGLTASDKVLLVEPNPLNLEKLSLCWSEYPQASIKNLGIVPRGFGTGSAAFFFARADEPHFQVGSFAPDHVLHHYPDLNISDLETVLVETMDLESFISQAVGSREISLLSLDIEGFDADIILGTNFDSLNLKYLSFEHIHLGDRISQVVTHLEKYGFFHRGYGIDYQGYDWLFKKES